MTGRPSLDRLTAASAADVAEAVLTAPEDQWFDRKSARVHERELAKTLIAMANAEGGMVAVGVYDGKIEHVSEDARNRLRRAPIDYANPSLPVRVREHHVERCTVLLFEVAPSEGLHEDQRGQAFLRVGDTDHSLSFDERMELTYAKGVVVHDGSDVPRATIDDLDAGIIADYVRSEGASDPRALLDARGLTKGDTVTVAGLILAARRPTDFKPGACLRILRVNGAERLTGTEQNIAQDIRLEGPLPTLAQDAYATAVSLLPRRRALGADGRFVWTSELPTDALREAIVNALIHRSYSIEGDHIRIWIYDDRIDVESPGRFPDPRMAKDLSRSGRRARNPRIARACSDLGIGQELGEGLRRMEALMRGAGLPAPIIDLFSETTRVTLPLVPIDLPDSDEQIIEALRRGGALRTGELMGLLGVSRPTLRRRLSKLEREGRIVRKGTSQSDPQARWMLVTANPKP